MKRIFFISSLFFAFHPLFAQWQPAGATSGNIYYNGGKPRTKNWPEACKNLTTQLPLNRPLVVVADHTTAR